ncbi:MAG: prenyltransferase [Candidatus Aureabacteria bacterium]|nr:prenyltransferase [Candidatus Auribacterota bacterium]
MKTEIRFWLRVARAPFLPVGVMPYLLGTAIAARSAGAFNLPIFLLGAAAILLILLAAHFNGEIHDVREDALSGVMGRNIFSGGSQEIVRNPSRAPRVETAARAAVTGAVAIGLILQFYCRTGAWTIPLGLTGIFAGYYYSKPPFRFASRGIGELLIAFCYGWLPVAVGCYLQSGAILPLVHWVSIPVACSVFNIILINEFPDYPADALAGKRNLAVRIGLPAAAWVYAAAGIAGGAALCALPRIQMLTGYGGVFYLPVAWLAMVLSLMMARGHYTDPVRLLWMCGLTIVVNLGASAAAIAGTFLARG